MANYGYEAAQTIKTRQKQAVKPTPQTVIIALSATAFDEDRVLMLASGCDDFVSKPFKRDLLLHTMAHHLGLRYLYDESVAIVKSLVAIAPATAETHHSMS